MWVVLEQRRAAVDRPPPVLPALEDRHHPARELVGGLEQGARAMAAHGKITGAILTILPIGIAIMMMVVSPGYIQVLFNHPMGKNLIGAAIACLVIAHFVIRKLVDIKV